MMTMQQQHDDSLLHHQDHVRSLSDHVLLNRIHQSALESKRRLVQEIVMLGEIQRRGLHLAMAYSTMYEFCYRELRFSEDQAYRYMLAVRLVEKFPEILDDLESGRLHLASLALLNKHVWLKEHDWLLDLARGKSKRELEKALAQHFPKHDAEAPSSRIQPLSETRSRLEVTLSAETIEKIEYAKQLMSHANPAQHVEVVIDKALDALIAKLEKSRLAKIDRPRAEGPRAEGPRAKRSRAEGSRAEAPRAEGSRAEAPRAEGPRAEDVSRRTRRMVFERDGWQCTFVSDSGARCESQVFLELDHKVPRALNGSNAVENLRVVCRSHNQHEARRLLGEEKITSAIAWTKAKFKSRPGRMREHGVSNPTSPMG